MDDLMNVCATGRVPGPGQGMPPEGAADPHPEGRPQTDPDTIPEPLTLPERPEPPSREDRD
ncbi:hypothetical protein AA103196_1859 [Ameyamaea chiangmaiensis NBRC 103196]|uniref:Uncharacterized protein n=1 Tax=Ameyamaea chiangmaiensis TaxID=442969 RepID=A0A850PHU6_9PROT|nr:hypothetical protein [Ameyamaea chiangmaiensis]MBS4073876.1 hypothetical protein [Ameyamaea chiangmaiensis]NVN41402.1 hypothetical protein [Ameyamaea chiangmaiensis]GBQ68092.1 hypothetical protein AA103196_1859 [Ameyamaea chiangmaiensis NBRC 103196]